LARSGHTAIFSGQGEKIYIFGGFTGKEVLNDVCIFDTKECSWEIVKLSSEEEQLL
jgi:hypothetical protein